MPINPHFKDNWRPTKDLNRTYSVGKSDVEIFDPKNKQEAINYVVDLALPDIVCFDGFVRQQEMIEDEAARLFPYLFKSVEVAEASVEPEDVVQAFFDAHKNPENGRIDWNWAAEDTTYVVTVTKLPPILLHRATLTLVDAEVKVG